MEHQEQVGHQNRSVVSIGDWIVTMIIMLIPVINFIMLLVWAFSGGTPKSKSNWAKATLIFMVLGAILTFVFWGTITAIAIGASR
jgi:Na+/phosphate symporter